MAPLQTQLQGLRDERAPDIGREPLLLPQAQPQQDHDIDIVVEPQLFSGATLEDARCCERAIQDEEEGLAAVRARALAPTTTAARRRSAETHGATRTRDRLRVVWRGGEANGRIVDAPLRAALIYATIYSVVSVLLYLIAFFTVIYYFYLQLHHHDDDHINPAGDESNDEDEESRNNEGPWAAYVRIFHLPQDKDFHHDVWGSHNQILRAHVVLRLVLYLAVFPFLAFVWLRCLCAQVLPWLACSNSVKATHARDLWAAGERKLYLLRWRSGSCCGPASAVVELSLSWEDLAAVTAGHVKVQRGNSCRLLLGCCGKSNGGADVVPREPPRPVEDNIN